MTAAELLSPRFEVVEEYPNCEFSKGQILSRIKYATHHVFHADENAVVGGLYLVDIEKHPHLFRKMNWWENRKEEDMPKRLLSLLDGEDTTFYIKRWDMINLFGITDEKDGRNRGCSLLTFNPEYGYIPID